MINTEAAVTWFSHCAKFALQLVMILGGCVNPTEIHLINRLNMNIIHNNCVIESHFKMGFSGNYFQMSTRGICFSLCFVM